ncbi:hypothetical protein CGC21_7005 [Leishmania donovani]|uniref:Uncharacterized protein n=1 Tax=Leishmania donovani TaxID=5661 RepID=A0A504X9R0_LEIDO|nr:hypothetical protein CGC21_7005 [Leishmania donovani]
MGAEETTADPPRTGPHRYLSVLRIPAAADPAPPPVSAMRTLDPARCLVRYVRFTDFSKQTTLRAAWPPARPLRQPPLPGHSPATVKGVRVERRLERLLPPPAQGSIRTAAGCRKCEHGVQAPWGTAGTVYHAQAQHPAHAAQPVCIPTGRADEAQTPGAWREHRRALQTPTRRVAAPDHGIARLAAALGAGARHAGRASEGPAPRLARLLLELVRRARWPPPVTRATETPSPLPWSAGRCRRPCLDRGMRPSGGPSGARGARLDFAAEGGAP